MELGIGTPAGPRRIDAQEGFLGDILGFAFVAEVPKGEIAHRPFVAHHDLLEGAHVPAREEEHQLASALRFGLHRL